MALRESGDYVLSKTYQHLTQTAETWFNKTREQQLAIRNKFLIFFPTNFSSINITESVRSKQKKTKEKIKDLK